MHSAPRSVRHARSALLLLLLLAGCAGEGGLLGAEPAEEDVSAAGVVRAFASVCGNLDGAEVARRGANLGFVAVGPARQAAQPVPLDPNVRLMARPAVPPASVSALLAFNRRGPSCELAVGGVSSAALEREFERMVGVLQRQENLLVSPLRITSATAADAGGLRVHRAVLVVPRALQDAGPQVIVLRTAPDAPGGQPLRAIMSLHVARPREGGSPGGAIGPGAIPPPASPLAMPRG